MQILQFKSVNNKNLFLTTVFFVFTFYSCTYNHSEVVPQTGFPENVEKILVSKCASTGCHNSASRITAAGLDFSTWDLMFEGGRNGTSVIPFSTDYSFMLYTVNTDTNRGPVLLPSMPYLQNPLSNQEYETLYNWILNGAPDTKGFVKFSDDPNRKKIYVCMQGCDKVAVLDAKTKVIMRYISVGEAPGMIEAPHMVRVSPDGNYWYAVFISGSYIQKFRTSDDALVGSVNIGFGSWNSVIITPDGSKGFVNSTGTNTVQVVNLNTMTLETSLTFETPHGGFVTPDGNYLYLTSQNGNFINKIAFSSAPFYDDVNYIILVPGQQKISSSSIDPHEMILSPDGSKYFITCQTSNEVRIFQASNDSLLAAIPVGTKPQELAVSDKHPYVFVTCTEDPISSNEKGSVYIINYNDFTVQPKIYTGYQPHGIAADDEEELVYVANLNYDSNGPAPHHISKCGGRNGTITIIDMKTLSLYRKTLSDGNSFEYKNEVLSFPYFISIRQ